MSNHDACEKRIAELEAENAALKERVRIRDLGKIERAKLFKRESERGLSGSEIARLYGYERGAYVMTRIRILRHGSPKVIAAWDAGQINDTKAEELARANRTHADQDIEVRRHLTRTR